LARRQAPRTMLLLRFRVPAGQALRQKGHRLDALRSGYLHEFGSTAMNLPREEE
jgi:hypothetical protein